MEHPRRHVLLSSLAVLLYAGIAILALRGMTTPAEPDDDLQSLDPYFWGSFWIAFVGFAWLSARSFRRGRTSRVLGAPVLLLPCVVVCWIVVLVALGGVI